MSISPSLRHQGPSSEEAVGLSNVWYSYNGGAPALREIDLTVARGSSTVVIGASGSGKTTLLKTINGLLRPSSGSVTVLGTCLNGDGSFETVRRRTGYIPQQLGLVRSLSARENVLIGALPRVNWWRSLLGAFPSEEVGRANDLLEVVGIAHKAEEKAYRLSGGERQRVAIARALMQDPALILADEFVSDLDYARAQEIMNLLQEIRKWQGVTLVMVLHNMELATQFADRVVILKGGLKVAEGGPSILTQAGMAEVLA